MSYSKLLQEMIGCAALCVCVTMLTPSKTESEVSHADIRWYDTGKITANGERFDPAGLTFASKSLRFGTLLDIRWKSAMITVRCNDRGPNEVELTKGGFSKLEDPSIGVLVNAEITKHK